MSSYRRVGQETSTAIEAHYEDHGYRSLVVLIHGWLLSGASPEKQTAAVRAADHRATISDRGGFGRPGKPAVCYHYDRFSADLNAGLSARNFTDVSLVGFSMGTGELTQYIGKHGAKRGAEITLDAKLL